MDIATNKKSKTILTKTAKLLVSMCKKCDGVLGFTFEFLIETLILSL